MRAGDFGVIVDRDVQAVFGAALDVVRDSAVAAELAIEAFAEAWEHDESDGLVDATRARAEAWVVDNGWVPDADWVDDGPGFTPMWRARIVSGLEVRGIPTRASGHRHMTTKARGLAAAGVAAAAVVVAWVTVIGADPGELEVADEASTTTTSVGAWPDRQMLGPGKPTTTTTGAPVTTTTTVEQAPVTTARPPATQPSGDQPSTTVAPPPPAPPPPPPPGPPVFRSATASFRAQDVGLCSKSNESLLTIQWQVDNATQVWIYRDAEPWEAVSPGAGTARYCSPSTREYHLVARDAQGREDRATVTAPGLP